MEPVWRCVCVIFPHASQTNRSGVQDLQLPPAFCLPQDAPLLKALEAAYDRDFDHLPWVAFVLLMWSRLNLNSILNAKRRPIGYLDIPSIKGQFKDSKINGDEPVCKYANRAAGHWTLMKLLICVASQMIHFSLSSRSHPYTVISPLTPLEELEEFFKSRRIDFALGESIWSTAYNITSCIKKYKLHKRLAC